jgi:hypothetical protein
MATAEEIADEAKRARKVTHIVDITTALIRQSGMSRRDTETLVAHVREQILRLFPGSEQTYEVIYTRRFRRLIDEFTRSSPARPGVP